MIIVTIVIFLYLTFVGVKVYFMNSKKIVLIGNYRIILLDKKQRKWVEYVDLTEGNLENYVVDLKSSGHMYLISFKSEKNCEKFYKKINSYFYSLSDVFIYCSGKIDKVW